MATPRLSFRALTMHSSRDIASVPLASWAVPGTARARASAMIGMIAFILMFGLLYSYLRASIGSSRDALRAG